MANAVNWFEIPASDLGRACKFYGDVLNIDIHRHDVMGLKMGFIHNGEDGVGGALVQGEGYVPTANGALIYLNGGQDLNEPLNRVENAGGQVVLPKTQISEEIGHMGVFMDTEGNRVAFHSPA